mgnify:CR=1 FL=1
MWREIKTIIKNNNRFLLTTHIHADGDGIGAACALTELLIKMNKQVKFVCDSPIPHKYAFLDFHNTHFTYSDTENYDDTEVLVILDTNKLDRIGRLSNLATNPNVKIICIDHHPIESIEFTPYYVVDPTACSVGAMVYALLKEFGFPLDLEAAKGIYTSVICDTGRFSYASTNRKAHKIADECIRIGVDPDEMYSNIFQHISIAEIKIFAKALQRMEIYLDNQIVIQEIRKEDYANLDVELVDIEHIDLEYFLEFNKLIEDVKCVVLLREIGEKNIRVSIRTKANLDISPIIESLGGGGHKNAAGVTWNGTVQEIKEIIIEKLKNLLTISQKKTQKINEEEMLNSFT